MVYWFYFVCLCLQIWETRYILLLWLSMVCMVPFEMSRLDGQLDGGNKKPIASRIIEETQVQFSLEMLCKLRRILNF